MYITRVRSKLYRLVDSESPRRRRRWRVNLLQWKSMFRIVKISSLSNLTDRCRWNRHPSISWMLITRYKSDQLYTNAHANCRPRKMQAAGNNKIDITRYIFSARYPEGKLIFTWCIKRPKRNVSTNWHTRLFVTDKLFSRYAKYQYHLIILV